MKNPIHYIYATNITIFDYFAAGLFTLLAQIITAWIKPALLKISFQPIWLNQIVWYVLLFVLPILLFSPCIKRAAHNHFVSSDDRFCCIKHYLIFVTPGEIVRFILCIMPMQYVFTKSQWYISLIPTNFGMAYAPFVNTLFANTYGIITNRQYEVSNYYPFEVELIAEDFIFYMMFHAVYIIAYLFIQYQYYWYEWKKESVVYHKWHDEMLNIKQEWCDNEQEVTK